MIKLWITQKQQEENKFGAWIQLWKDACADSKISLSRTGTSKGGFGWGPESGNVCLNILLGWGQQRAASWRLFESLVWLRQRCVSSSGWVRSPESGWVRSPEQTRPVQNRVSETINPADWNQHKWVRGAPLYHLTPLLIFTPIFLKP